MSIKALPHPRIAPDSGPPARRNVALVGALVIAAVGIGATGDHGFADLPWLDASRPLSSARRLTTAAASLTLSC